MLRHRQDLLFLFTGARGHHSLEGVWEWQGCAALRSSHWIPLPSLGWWDPLPVCSPDRKKPCWLVGVSHATMSWCWFSCEKKRRRFKSVCHCLGDFFFSQNHLCRSEYHGIFAPLLRLLFLKQIHACAYMGVCIYNKCTYHLSLWGCISPSPVWISLFLSPAFVPSSVPVPQLPLAPTSLSLTCCISAHPSSHPPIGHLVVLYVFGIFFNLAFNGVSQ